MVVHHRGQKIVGHADRVEVSGEVEVNVLHRKDLRVTSAGGAALDAKAWAEARLPQANDRLLAKFVEGIAEADGCRGLSFSGRCRRNGGNQNQFAAGPAGQCPQIVQRNLRLIVPVEEKVFRDRFPVSVSCDVQNRTNRAFPERFECRS